MTHPRRRKRSLDVGYDSSVNQRILEHNLIFVGTIIIFCGYNNSMFWVENEFLWVQKIGKNG